MIEVINDYGSLMLSSDNYPLKLIKSFTVTTSLLYSGQGAPADWCGAQTALQYDPTLIVFTRARTQNIYVGVGWEGTSSAAPIINPVNYGLAVITTKPAVVDVWVCRSTYGEEAPPADSGIELYNSLPKRTFSTTTVAIPFEKVILAQQAPTGTLRHSNMASGVAMNIIYTLWSNPLSQYWIQVQNINLSSYSAHRLGLVYSPGGVLPNLVTTWGPTNSGYQPQQPVYFIDKSRLPLPFG